MHSPRMENLPQLRNRSAISLPLDAGEMTGEQTHSSLRSDEFAGELLLCRRNLHILDRRSMCIHETVAVSWRLRRERASPGGDKVNFPQKINCRKITYCIFPSQRAKAFHSFAQTGREERVPLPLPPALPSLYRRRDGERLQ